MFKLDKIRGLIYGQAIGDALGLSTEFMNKEKVIETYKSIDNLSYENIVQDDFRDAWIKGDWTDDTDQMILILECINEGVLTPENFASKLHNWYFNGYKELGDIAGCGVGKNTRWVINHPDFLSDPLKASKEIWMDSECSLSSNGGLMRTSILAITNNYIDNAINICKTTHYDPRCQLSCVFQVYILRELLQNNYNVDIILSEAYNLCEKLFDSQTIEKFNKYYQLDLKKIKSLKKLKLNEKIGYTFKTLMCGIWALHQINNGFKPDLIYKTLIFKGGDSDTNASVAGAIIGSYIGYKKLPNDLKTNLINKNFLEKKIPK